MRRFFRLLRCFAGLTALLIVVALLGFTIWAYTPADPMPEAVAALRSDARVTVVADPWLTFRPTEGAPTVGLIFYPGGRVDPRAYAPAMRALAEAEYLAVVVPMPFNLAVFGADRAADVQAAFPEIAHWAVGGHSLGGAMAARFVHRHPDVVDGLALWACPGQKAHPFDIIPHFVVE